jgi:hypothetical protein
LVKYLTDKNIKFYGLSPPLVTHADACCLFVGGGEGASQIKKIDGPLFYFILNHPESFTTWLRRLNFLLFYVFDCPSVFVFTRASPPPAPPNQSGGLSY